LKASSAGKRVVLDLEQDEDESSMNSLPNPSSDVEEPEAPMEPLGRFADPKLLSSSPPPSSPIITSSDMDLLPPDAVASENSEDEGGKFELPVTSTTNFESSDDFVKFMLQATSNPPAAPSPSQASAAKFVSEIFDWGSDDTLAGSSSATPFDDFEFLEGSNNPQPLSSTLSFDYNSLGMGSLEGLGDVGAEFRIGEFWQSVKPLMEQSSLVKGGASGTDVGGGSAGEQRVDSGDKLANGMVDLFGGCLV
jgi:hypothetical protein